MVVKNVRFNCIEKVWEIQWHHVLTDCCTFEQPQHQRGVANGLSLCLNSISKAMGPAGGGSLFALGQTRQDAYILPGNELVFTILAFVAVLSAVTTFEPILPRSTDHPYSDDDK
jgi:hypothetical protein